MSHSTTSSIVIVGVIIVVVVCSGGFVVFFNCCLPASTMSKSEMLPTLTPETAIDILNKTLEELESPENVQRIDEARSAIGNEMLKMMQYMFPMVMQIQLDVLKEFGYPEGRDGPIRFAQVLRTLEKEDEEIARLHSLIKAYYLPPVEVLAANDSSIEEKQ